MNRRNLLTLSLTAILGGLACRVSGAGSRLPKPPKAPEVMPCTSAPPLEAWDMPTPKLSGHTGKSLVCQCPACNGSGFRGEDRDECGYCHMNGHLVTTEAFGMYNGEGNAEVWRALVWHEWSQRNWKESDGPKPWLPGMLYFIGQQHPEVYDTAVRENIFVWLTKRFDKKHAEGQYDAWVAEVERREAYPDEKRYGRDGTAKKEPFLCGHVVFCTSHPSPPTPMTVEECVYLTKDGQHPMVRCVWFEGESVKRGFFHPSELVLP